MHLLDSRHALDTDSERTRLGEVLWGIELDGCGKRRMLGVCWEWREVIANVVALSNPMAVRSNVLLKDERGEAVSEAKRLLHLNAAVNAFPWQGHLTGRGCNFHTRAA